MDTILFFLFTHIVGVIFAYLLGRHYHKHDWRGSVGGYPYSVAERRGNFWASVVGGWVTFIVYFIINTALSYSSKDSHNTESRW